MIISFDQLDTVSKYFFKMYYWGIPWRFGGETQHSHCRGPGLAPPGQATKIPQAEQCGHPTTKNVLLINVPVG